MKERISVVLGVLALSAVALIGCSPSADAADAQDLAGSGQTTQKASSAATTAGQVTVTTLSAAEFQDQRGEATCLSYAGLSYCQKLQSHGFGSAAYVDWTAYVGVPDDSIDATMEIGGQGFEYSSRLEADASYAKVVWSSPSIPSLMSLATDVRFTLHDGTIYSASNMMATYESRGAMYDEEELTIEPA